MSIQDLKNEGNPETNASFQQKTSNQALSQPPIPFFFTVPPPLTSTMPTGRSVLVIRILPHAHFSRRFHRCISLLSFSPCVEKSSCVLRNIRYPFVGYCGCDVGLHGMVNDLERKNEEVVKENWRERRPRKWEVLGGL